MSRASRAVLTLAGGLRTGWLIVGVTLLLGLVLEGSCRVRERLVARRQPKLVHPLATQAWWPEWSRLGETINGPSRFDPYRGWWAAPYRTRYVNADSLGRRLTVPGPGPGPVARRVLFLGGSAIWGFTSPDSLTIPSLISRRLQALGYQHVEVVNLAQPSYNTTQGLVTLLLELRDGRVPDVVISMDGINDVVAVMTEHEAGTIANQGDMARRSAVGWRGLRANVLGLLRYSALGRALLVRPDPDPTDAEAARLCGDLAGQYAQQVRIGTGLGRAFGFKAFYFWQPHSSTTEKPATAWERAIGGEAALPPLMRRCTRAVDSVMTAKPDSAFRSLTHLFDADTGTIFVDPYAHVTPEGNQRMAGVFTDVIVRAIGAPDRERQPGQPRP